MGIHCNVERKTRKGAVIMSGVVLVGAFGMSLVTIGILENLGVKVNEGALTIILECVKFGGILYILKLAATTFLFL